MHPDKYQRAWQAHSSQTRVTVDADLLLKEVQRSQLNFRATIFCRDFSEVVVAILLIPLWFYLGARIPLPWTWYLTVPVLVWIAGFMLAYRMRHKQKPGQADEPLLRCVERSLTEVENQIWLLRNVFWWYLLPPTISISAFFGHVAWLTSKDWLEALGSLGGSSVFVLALYCSIDYINQRAVRLQLEPRRQELLALLASLGGDDSAEEHASMSSAQSVENSTILRRWFIVAALCLLAFVVMILTGGIADSSHDGPPRSSGPAGDSLARVVAEQSKEKNLVGLAAMVMVDGRLEAAAAIGERKKGSGVPLEISDRWHLGGITKSITATMIARLIESGQMQWTDTVGEIFPETSVHEDWKLVTLRQLLTNTAGAPVNFPKEVSRQWPALGLECTQARREAVLKVMAEKPAYPPGTQYVSSNVGYTIAGAMAEKATGVSWEDLVKREVFEPLQLRGAGYGPPKSPDETLEQPRGHRARLAGKVAVDDETDNTPIIGPAAAIHMTLADLCSYATEHLRGDRGAGKLLSPETYKRLQSTEFGRYACGWLRKEPSVEIPHTVYWSSGSNTLWYSLVAFIPEKNMVIAVASNDGDLDRAEAAAWEIVKAMKWINVEGNSTRRQSLRPKN